MSSSSFALCIMNRVSNVPLFRGHDSLVVMVILEVMFFFVIMVFLVIPVFLSSHRILSCHGVLCFFLSFVHLLPVWFCIDLLVKVYICIFICHVILSDHVINRPGVAGAFLQIQVSGKHNICHFF